MLLLYYISGWSTFKLFLRVTFDKRENLSLEVFWLMSEKGTREGEDFKKWGKGKDRENEGGWAENVRLILIEENIVSYFYAIS